MGRLKAIAIMGCITCGQSWNASAEQLKVDVTSVQDSKGGNIVLELWRRDPLTAKFPRSIEVPPAKTNGAQGENPCNWAQPLTVCRLAVRAAAATVSAVFRDLPPGDYAIAIYHDANRNWRYEFPQEGYGFSNNAPFLGLSFDRAAVRVTGSAETSITMHYN